MSALFRHVATPPAGVPIVPRGATPPGGVPSSPRERFSAWRDQVRHDQRPAPIPPSSPPVPAEPHPSWRDEIVAWTRAVRAGAIDHAAPSSPRIAAVLARFALARPLEPALVLLYGAHLCGERGAAPVDVAHVLDRQWDEALGKGELAQRGVAIYAASRVRLSPLILRVLDELPPTLGPLVGEPGGASPLLGPCVTVAPPGESLLIVAARCLPRAATALLVAHGDPDLAALTFEARAHGAIPLVRLADPARALPPDPTIFVAADDAEATASGLPLLE